MHVSNNENAGHFCFSSVIICRDLSFQVSDFRVPPAVSQQATQLRQYLTKLQSTIESIASGSDQSSESEVRAFFSLHSSSAELINSFLLQPPVEELTSQLHDEYQMMSGTLNQLESMLLGQGASSSPSRGDTWVTDRCGSNVRGVDELGLLDCVVTDRDEVIRRLSERVRKLCRANDQLYMDFESQEQLLTKEMRQLRQQLEEANHAIQLLACHDCDHQAANAVQGGVSAMREAEEQIAKLRRELQEKDRLLRDIQTSNGEEERELKRKKNE